MPEETSRILYLAGKIMYAHGKLITYKMKGVFLDRLFNLLRDTTVSKVQGQPICEILSGIRS